MSGLDESVGGEIRVTDDFVYENSDLRVDRRRGDVDVTTAVMELVVGSTVAAWTAVASWDACFIVAVDVPLRAVAGVAGRGM